MSRDMCPTVTWEEFRIPTKNGHGSEIRRSPVEVDSFIRLSHYLQGFSTIPGGFLARFLVTMNSISQKSRVFESSRRIPRCPRKPRDIIPIYHLAIIPTYEGSDYLTSIYWWLIAHPPEKKYAEIKIGSVCNLNFFGINDSNQKHTSVKNHQIAI